MLPKLNWDGIEITQGIQIFGRSDVDKSERNTVPTIADKDTVVRVYLSSDRSGFDNDRMHDITGILEVEQITGRKVEYIKLTNPFEIKHL